jgi:hypothetical protein
MMNSQACCPTESSCLFLTLFYSQDDKSSRHEGSTWSNVLSKLKMMAPYVWPKGSWWRQLIVLGCLLILGAGRGINVFVPIYNKYIGSDFL